ncbi:MAG: polyprenyl diphosphate synthase [Candidatus Aenigmatarchaeota archaeon]
MRARRSGIHIGIIPDGSRRWGKKTGIKNYDKQSGITIEKIVKHVFYKYPEVAELSIWAMSTENLGRIKSDKSLIYGLLKGKINDLIRHRMLSKKDIKVNVIGSRLKEMPQEVLDAIRKISAQTKNNKGPILNLCIGYGGKEEILNAVMESSRWLRNNPMIAKLHENVFEGFLMVPRPLDIVIRTGGEKRLSGFMLYQIEYAELFFVDTLWPDFGTKEFDKVMKEFKQRNRRFGE